MGKNIVISQIETTTSYMNYLEITGSIVGLLYLWLEYKANIYLWVASIIMPAIYIVVYYQAGLYADFGINIYFLLASVYGWIAWAIRKRNRQDSETENDIRHFDKSELPLTAVIFAVCFLLIAWILISYTDSTVPWLDSFTTSASIIAMWMLARKYAEQWLVWIAVDIVSSGLYIYKSLYFTAILYMIYTVIAVMGYRNWIKMINNKE